MKVGLLDKDQDFEPRKDLPMNEQEVAKDLGLDTLWGAMAGGDQFLYDVARTVILCGSGDADAMRFRQGVLKDCIANAAVVRQLYTLTLEAIEDRKKSSLGIYSRYPSSLLYDGIRLMEMMLDRLNTLRCVADRHAKHFTSEGFSAFFSMIQRELTDAYLAQVARHLTELKFKEGVWISANLGKGNKGTHYVLRKPPDRKRNWFQRIFANKPPVYSFSIADRDESGARALSELRDRGIHQVAGTLAQSAEHVLGFFRQLRTELGFYIGSLNLYERLVQKGEPVCFPEPVDPVQRRLSFRGLYDVCLSLNQEQRVVGNDLLADGRDVVVITGANQGGKSTFLRSIGLAYLMMQAGMFVPAESFQASVAAGLFTHFKRKEDEAMKSGKFDEELRRMDDIVRLLVPYAILLLNESFAATNEREGSAIARQIVRALMEKGIRVFFVTHLYDFARSWYDQDAGNTVFLRAERRSDGGRTFKIQVGEPLPTGYGKDLYNAIFGTASANR